MSAPNKLQAVLEGCEAERWQAPRHLFESGDQRGQPGVGWLRARRGKRRDAMRCVLTVLGRECG